MFSPRTFLLAGMLVIGAQLVAQDEQTSRDEPFAIYAHFGINGSQVQNDGLGGFDKLNMMGGLGLTRTISKNFGLGFEINYIGKGSKRNSSGQNSNPNQYRLNLDYVQVPVLLLSEMDSKIDFFGGLALGFLLSATEQDFFGTNDLTDDFEPIEFSLILGGAYQISDHWLAEVRFDQSLLSIRDNPQDSTPQYQGRQYNTVLGIYLTYLIKPKSGQ